MRLAAKLKRPAWSYIFDLYYNAFLDLLSRALRPL